MKHIQSEYSCINFTDFMRHILPNNCTFVDIETTGFSSLSSHIYLIGCLKIENHKISANQFLAQKPEEESDILEAFLKYIQDTTSIITFNGTTFDLPFIENRCKALNICANLNTKSHLDIYKEVISMKSILQLTNYKQKTIETFLGIDREDIYSGKDLISIFHEYTKTQDPKLEQLLLLHNYEDIIGMPNILPILTYKEIFRGHYKITDFQIQNYISYEGEKNQECIITLHNNFDLPTRISVHKTPFTITMTKNLTKIRIPVHEGFLKHYFADYKNYYYLPKEDMAIHKSVAEYVDKVYRQKATPSTCYTKKYGTFLPQFAVIETPLFLKELKDKISYFEICENFLTSEEAKYRYTSHILQTLLSLKK